MKLKIVKLLKKLIRHERSARAIGNFGEADNYARQIRFLREKHNIFEEIPLEEDADFENEGYDAEFAFTAVSPLFRRKRIVWEENLFHLLCDYFGCGMNLIPRTNLKIAVGEKAERRAVIESYLHLSEISRKSADKFLIENSDFKIMNAPLKKLARESFLHGFCHGIFNRLQIVKSAEEKIEEINRELHRRNLTNLETDSEPSDQPIQSQALVKSRRIITSDRKRQLDEKYSKAKKIRRIKIKTVDEDSYRAGGDEARICPLNDEIAIPAKTIFDDLDKASNKLAGHNRYQVKIPLYNGNFTVITIRMNERATEHKLCRRGEI